MPVQQLHTFVVHPRKGEVGGAQVNGTALRLDGKMFELLSNIYVKSEQESDVEITFTPAVDGKQQNDCRDLICAYLNAPTLTHGRRIAERLERNTDGRSGIGLLFIICGREGREHKIVISRFPTDNAIYVDEDPRKLTVEFLERVFMKNKASYKAAVYRDVSTSTGLWNGRAIDKQLNNPVGEFSNYWIVDFLASQLTVTAAAGTRRLANALRAAVKKSDLHVKQEIIAAATLAKGLANKRLNIEEFCRHFGLSREARAAVTGQLKTPRLAQERFNFDADEFQNVIAFKTIELSNGGTLTAPSSDFNEIFHREYADGTDGDVRFITQGRIINEKLKPTR
jgi:hypothetical protein